MLLRIILLDHHKPQAYKYKLYFCHLDYMLVITGTVYFSVFSIFVIFKRNTIHCLIPVAGVMKCSSWECYSTHTLSMPEWIKIVCNNCSKDLYIYFKHTKQTHISWFLNEKEGVGLNWLMLLPTLFEHAKYICWGFLFFFWFCLNQLLGSTSQCISCECNMVSQAWKNCEGCVIQGKLHQNKHASFFKWHHTG